MLVSRLRASIEADQRGIRVAGSQRYEGVEDRCSAPAMASEILESFYI